MKPEWGNIEAQRILLPVQGDLVSGSPYQVFKGLCTDSRKLGPGQLFWALKGERYDGHDFVSQAITKGAAGVVVQRDYGQQDFTISGVAVIAVPDTLKALGDLAKWWRRQYPAQVIAITGSVGKTTTKEMASAILNLDGMTLKNEGNLNNLIGLPLTLLLLQGSHRRAVLEMGMNQPGEIARLTDIANPDIGLITNVARAHLEGLGDIHGVARAKVELLENMDRNGQGIINGDDEILMSEASPYSKNLITYGFGNRNAVRAEKIKKHGREGVSFIIRYDNDSIPIRLRVTGIQSIYNAMAASVIAICLKLPHEHLVEGLRGFEGTKGRFVPIPLPGGATIIDDTYNSNPSSLRAALDTVKEWALDGGRVIIGLGEMLELGDETIPAHSAAGEMIAELCPDYFMAMGDHAQVMIEAAIGKGFPVKAAIVVGSHREMAQKILDIMKKGDLILLKGSRKMGLEKVIEMITGSHEN